MITVIPKDRDGGPVEVVRTVNHVFTIDVLDDDLPVAVNNGVITIRNGGTKHVDGASVTAIAGVDGTTASRLSYTWSSSDHPETPRADVLVELTTTTTGGVPVHWRIRCDLVRWGVRMALSEDDLFTHYPALRNDRMLGVEEGVADSGDTTSVIDAKLKQLPDDYFNGGEVTIIAGTNEGETRRVADFARGAGDLTVDVAFPSAIDTTSRYRVRRSWQPIIVEAWDEIRRRLRDGGRRAHLIVDATELRTPHLYLAAAHAFQANTAGGVEGDDWMIGQELERRYDHWFRTRSFTYDVSDDGEIDGTVKGETSIMGRV